MISALGNMTLEKERMRMATYLNLSPGHPETWPTWVMDRLINIEHTKGRDEMLRDISRLMSP